MRKILHRAQLASGWREVRKQSSFKSLADWVTGAVEDKKRRRAKSYGYKKWEANA
jgi:hypothetical protein